MRSRIVAALLFLVAGFTAAHADQRTYWDYTKQQWMVGDSKSAAFRGWRIPREMVQYGGAYAPGTIVVDTASRRLLFIMDGGKAIEYAIGVGREGFQWSGTDVITQKAEWPTWKPPTEMIAREKVKGHILAQVMPGGLDNPLGARALYIGFSFYRIHGTTDPKSVGHAVSSGCIRLTNEDITDLYDRAHVGTRVVVLLNAPVAVKADPGAGVAAAAAVPTPRLNPLAPKVVAVEAVEPVRKPVAARPAAKVAKATPAAVAAPAAEAVVAVKAPEPTRAPAPSVPATASAPTSDTAADLLAALGQPAD